jgi:hypothetical protein
MTDLGETEGIATIEIDLDLVRDTREKLPLLKNRRMDVYARHDKLS